MAGEGLRDQKAEALLSNARRDLAEKAIIRYYSTGFCGSAMSEVQKKSKVCDIERELQDIANVDSRGRNNELFDIACIFNVLSYANNSCCPTLSRILLLQLCACCGPRKYHSDLKRELLVDEFAHALTGESLILANNLGAAVSTPPRQQGGGGVHVDTPYPVAVTTTATSSAASFRDAANGKSPGWFMKPASSATGPGSGYTNASGEDCTL